MILLAWRPFLDPIDAHAYWWILLLPLSLGTSMAYKAVRVQAMDRYWRSVLRMSVEILVAIAALGLVSFLFVEYGIPAIVPGD